MSFGSKEWLRICLIVLMDKAGGQVIKSIPSPTLFDREYTTSNKQKHLTSSQGAQSSKSYDMDMSGSGSGVGPATGITGSGVGGATGITGSGVGEATGICTSKQGPWRITNNNRWAPRKARRGRQR